MRRNLFNEAIATPGDSLEDVREATTFGEPSFAEHEPAPDDLFKWGGEIVDTDDTRVSFDGFETKEAMMAWLVDEIGLDSSDITELAD